MEKRTFDAGAHPEFRVLRVDDGIYSINDAGDSSFYLIEGGERAAVVDTGVTIGGRIMPLIRALTDKPLALLITHAHIDHMHHMDEFEGCPIYMAPEDAALPEDFLKGMSAGKDLIPIIRGTIPLSEETKIDLGGRAIEVCLVPGHTPGSCVFLDSRTQCLFTGDAIGSGAGVWMQVPCAVPLKVYRDSLIHLHEWLTARGGRMKFWGGHNGQVFMSSAVSGWNPLSMGLLCDLIDLVDGVVQGAIVGRQSNISMVIDCNPPLYASFGRAELQYDPKRIC